MLAGSGLGPYNTVPRGLTTVDIGIYSNSLLFFKSVFMALVISEETTKPNFLLRESFLIIFFTTVLIGSVKADRIKDMASIAGVRTNQLVG